MRNLKKILAVLLTVALMASMMVSALAATPVNTDKALKLQKIKLVAGEDESVLRLGDSLTRVEGMTFAIRAAGKEEEALAMSDAEVEEILANYTDAKDIPGWAVKYAAYAVKAGITKGTSADKLSPVAPLSGPMFVTFVLRSSMGYAEAEPDETLVDLAVAAKVLSPTQALATYMKSPFLRDDAVLVLYNAAMTGINKDGTPLITALINSGYVDQQAAYDAGFVPAPPAPVALTVDSVVATNLKEIVVNFNLPVDKDTAEDEANYELSTGGPVLEATVSGNSVTLKLTSDSIAQQTNIDVTVKNVKDTAGNKIADTKKSVTMVDTTIPQALSVTVTGPKSLEVLFSEPLEVGPTFVIDNGTYYAASDFVSGAKKVTLTLGVELAEGNHTVKVKDGLDFAGYKVPETSLTYTYAKDTTVPTFVVEKVTETKVTLKFNKPVKATNLNTDVTAYYAYNNDSNYQGFISAVNATNGYAEKYEVTFTRPIPQGTHTFYLNTKADKLEDKWGNDVPSAVITINAIVDNEKPTVTKVEMDGDKKIKVTFSEAVNTLDAVNKSYYVLKDSTGAVVKTSAYADVNNDGKFNSNASFSYSDKVVTITLTTPLPGGTYNLYIEKVRDQAYIQNTMDAVTIPFTVTDKTGPSLASAIISGDFKKVRVTFNEAMSAEGLTNTANYRIVANNGASIALPDKSTITIVDNKTVEIALGSVVSGFDGSGLDYIQASGTLKDVSGNGIGGFFTQVAVGTDSIGLVADSGSHKAISKNTITIKVNKELKAIDASKITYKVGGTDRTVSSAYFVNGSGESTVTVILPVDIKTDKSDLVNITLNADAITNVFGTKNTQLVVTAIDDAIAPEIVSVEAVDTTHIAITFSEEIKTTTVSKYTFAVAGNTVKDIAWDINNKVLTLELKDAIETDATPAVTQAYDLEDTSSNKKATGSTVPSTADKIVPVVVAAGGDDSGTATTPDAIAAGASFTIEFSEEMNATGKDNVETALEAVNSDFSFSWSGRILTVTNTGTAAANFTGDVTATLVDKSGNTNAGQVLFKY